VWVHHVFHWLQVNGFWTACIAWSVFGILTAAAAWRPWHRHAKVQAEIADRLNTKTPGGLTDLVKAVDKLREQDGGAGADHR
jgi:hypothetical protein